MTAGVVLVIDDDRDVRDAFELALADDGYEVQLADSGQIGLQLAAARRPDLVFLDLKMPGLDGVETLRRLQATDATIPVYVATAFAQEYMEGLRRAQQAVRSSVSYTHLDGYKRQAPWERWSVASPTK